MLVSQKEPLPLVKFLLNDIKKFFQGRGTGMSWSYHRARSCSFYCSMLNHTSNHLKIPCRTLVNGFISVAWPGEGMKGHLPSYFSKFGKIVTENAIKVPGYTFLPPSLKILLSFTLLLIFVLGHAADLCSSIVMRPPPIFVREALFG